MSYINAEEILPQEIIQEIQKYIDGNNIYIPKKTNSRIEWGQNTGIRQELLQRNTEIYVAFQSGKDTKEIAKDFCLSRKSIQRIIREKR